MYLSATQKHGLNKKRLSATRAEPDLRREGWAGIYAGDTEANFAKESWGNIDRLGRQHHAVCDADVAKRRQRARDILLDGCSTSGRPGQRHCDTGKMEPHRSFQHRATEGLNPQHGMERRTQNVPNTAIPGGKKGQHPPAAWHRKAEIGSSRQTQSEPERRENHPK